MRNEEKSGRTEKGKSAKGRKCKSAKGRTSKQHKEQKKEMPTWPASAVSRGDQQGGRASNASRTLQPLATTPPSLTLASQTPDLLAVPDCCALSTSVCTLPRPFGPGLQKVSLGPPLDVFGPTTREAERRGLLLERLRDIVGLCHQSTAHARDWGPSIAVAETLSGTLRAWEGMLCAPARRHWPSSSVNRARAGPAA